MVNSRYFLEVEFGERGGRGGVDAGDGEGEREVSNPPGKLSFSDRIELGLAGTGGGVEEEEEEGRGRARRRESVPVKSGGADSSLDCTSDNETDGIVKSVVESILSVARVNGEREQRVGAVECRH